MKRIVFDTETNGLLPELTTMHSLVLRDLDSKEVVSCADQAGYPSIEHGLELLSSAEVLYGHNALLYDIPAILKLYPRWTHKADVKDTLIVARMRWAHIKEEDFALWRRGKLPGKLIGTHKLEAWGYRLGILKGEYGKQEDAWSQWSPEMQTYCVRDTKVTKALVLHIRKSKGTPAGAVETEHELALYLDAQERNGFPFDMQKAGELQATLSARREAIRADLVAEFGSWKKKDKIFIPKRDNAKLGYKKGVPVQKYKTLTFNPGSRDHIASRLKKIYGWKPTVFTDGGKPQVDESILKGLDYPPVPRLLEFLLVNKRLSQLSEGDEQWMKHATKDRLGGGALTGMYHVHGRVNQSGTVTHRATHSKPNMSQVPKVTSPYGWECRGLFGVPAGWTEVGTDVSGLELRCLAHYMAKWDNGEYGRVILEGDIHSVNRDALGFSPDNAGRDRAKIWIYAYLYGAGDALLGEADCPNGSEEEKRAAGKRLRRRFEKRIPALGSLVETVRATAAVRGYLNLIDGRRAYVRSEHSALNTLLQGTGAVICKRWIVTDNRKLIAKYGPQGWNGKWAALGWFHDETQKAAREDIAEDVARIAVESIEDMTSHFKFRIPLTGEAKLGHNWAECH